MDAGLEDLVGVLYPSSAVCDPPPAIQSILDIPLHPPPVSSASHWPFQAIGNPDDVLETRGAVCNEISDLLAKVGRDEGEYSFGDAAPMLPSLPGLVVKNVGHVSLPLRAENADSLQREAKQIKPNLWMLRPHQVETQNPEWKKGIQNLGKLAAERLGFSGDIKLQPKLAMVVLYGEGGKLDRQQALNRSGHTVAVLEVVLPSVYAGGDLVVEQEGTNERFHFSLGKYDNTAGFRPHYAVYTTGAYRSVEAVTSGYRLEVVYALCLPPDLHSIGGNRPHDFLPMQLARAMTKLCANQYGVENEDGMAAVGTHSKDSKFALMVSNLPNPLYRGTESLKGVDSDRFQALRAANSLLPPERQLQFYIVLLGFKCYDRNYTQWKVESMLWHSLAGHPLISSTFVEWSKEPNFLNPDKNSLKQMWANGCTSDFHEHERFCIVGWPTVYDFENVLSWLGEPAVTEFALSGDPVDGARIRSLFRFETQRHSENIMKIEVPLSSLLQLTKSISKLGDIILVDEFFKLYFPRLQNTRQAIPAIAYLVRNAGWENVIA